MLKNSNILILLQAAEKLGIRFKVLDWQKYQIKLSWQKATHVITNKSLGINCKKAIVFTHNKSQVLKKLKNNGLPVLSQKIVKKPADWSKVKIPFPLVIKPVFGQKGKYVFLNIKDSLSAQQALKIVLQNQPPALIEPYFKAQDYRFLVLNNQLIGLSQRKPPVITADGRHNLKQLIEGENQRRLKLRQKLGRRMLNRLLVWPRIKWYLNQQGFHLSDIPAQNQKIIIYPLSNFSTGGQVKTINLSLLHPSYKKMALQAVKITGLTIAGLDMLIKNINQPANKKNSVILEINSDPGWRLHDWPNQGQSQHTAKKILQYIFNFSRE